MDTNANGKKRYLFWLGLIIVMLGASSCGNNISSFTSPITQSAVDQLTPAPVLGGSVVDEPQVIGPPEPSGPIHIKTPLAEFPMESSIEPIDETWAQDDGDPNANWPLIDDKKPYQGPYGLWMGGRNNAKDEIYRTIDLPFTIDMAKAEFRLYVQTDELANNDYDFLYLDLKSETTGQSLLQHPVTFTNRYTPRNQWVLQTIFFTQLQGLTEHQVRLSIGDTTNGSRITNFFIDVIEFKVHACKCNTKKPAGSLRPDRF